MNYNKDYKRRDEIINKYLRVDRNRKGADYFGGIERFDALPVEDLETLVKEKFADLDEAQNEAPTIKEFLEFANRYKDFARITFDGYVVSPDRSDYRVSVDAITIYPDAKNEGRRDMLAAAAMNFGKRADEADFDGDCFYLWWD